MTVNFIVTVQDWYGKRTVDCETEKQAWDAISSRTVGGLWDITSPTGMPLADFWTY